MTHSTQPLMQRVYDLPHVTDRFQASEQHVHAIFEALLLGVAGFGRIFLHSKALAIYLEAPREPFACLHPRHRYLNMHFLTGRHIGSLRITQVYQLPQGRWEHSVVLHEPGDVDDELLGWLRSAHRLAAH